MKSVSLLLFCCVLTKANNSIYDVSCSDRAEGLHFEPVFGARGRFALQWCTAADARVNKWKLDLFYYTSLKLEQCNIKFSGRAHALHSTFEEHVQLNVNCTDVCYKTNLDAIFGPTCYRLSMYLISEEKGLSLLQYDQLFYVSKNDTNFTKEHVSESKISVHYQNDGEDVIIDWYPDIPASLYHSYISLPNEYEVYEDMNCSSVAPQQVRCRARAPEGDYRAWFHHDAVWISLGLVRDKLKFHSDFRHLANSKGVLVSPSTTPGLWWAMGVVGVASLLGLVALVLHHLSRSDQLRQDIQGSWIIDVLSRHGARRREPRATERVVMLYARDCPAMVRAAGLLARLLRHAAGCEVLDLYCPDAVAAAAPAGGAWLRAQLTRAGSRVLLLQSPALALYCARPARADATGPLTLEAPLLGRRVAWRAPHAADALLQLALRLLVDSAHAEPLPFRKYYVASVEGVECADAVPALTPGRRYVLPSTAAALLADLAPRHAPLDAAARHLLEQLREALEDFRTYTVAHENYLFDELVIETTPEVE